MTSENYNHLETTRLFDERLGRFAPTPSGRLHVGNIFSFLISALYCKRNILRIDDLDQARSKQTHIDQIFRDLEWFGFEWEEPIVYESSYTFQHAYERFFEKLVNQNVEPRFRRGEDSLVYPCFCTRLELHSAQQPAEGALFYDSQFYRYPGTCRSLTFEEIQEKNRSKDPTFRLCVRDEVIGFVDIFQGFCQANLNDTFGDFVIRRSNGEFSYQLAVVIDDNTSLINTVIRGIDLLDSTLCQIYLQDLFGFDHPSYGHVPLIADKWGRKLSKRNGNATLSYLIDDLKLSSSQIIGYLAYLSGIIPEYSPFDIAELRKVADLSQLNNKRFITWKEPADHLL